MEVASAVPAAEVASTVCPTEAASAVPMAVLALALHIVNHELHPAAKCGRHPVIVLAITTVGKATGEIATKKFSRRWSQTPPAERVA